ncbi:MAG: LrgB family protein [Streptobacillus sp.]
MNLMELTKDPLFGMFLTLITFVLFKKLSDKVKSSLLNPLVLSLIFIIVFLETFKIPYENYYNGAEIFNTMIIPATVALAIPLYKNFNLLKKYYKEILFSIGFSTLVLTSLLAISMALLDVDKEILSSVLPKSVTTAIAVGVSEQIQGIQAITIIMVIICGNIGAVFGELIFDIFHIHHPIAQGISLGTTSHAVGTSKAIELGEIQGSMSGLAIIVTGLFTVGLAPIIYMIVSKIFY